MSSEAPQNHDKKGAAVKGQKGREKNLGPKKKYYKLVVRKLPLTNYDQTNFQSDLTKFSEKLQLTPQNFRFEHFIRGKLSRQRGPVSGVGFFSTDEDTAKVVLTNSQQIPFYEGDMNQSDIFLALYQTTFKTKERVDKLIGTYESDPEYLAFVAREEAPPQKRVSAEVLLDQKAATAKAAHTSGTASSSSAANDPRQSALLRFLRERSENRRRVGKGGSAAVTKKSDKRASDRRESRKDKERKGRPRKEKEKEEDRREDRPKRVPKSVVEGVSSQSSAQPPAVKILTKPRLDVANDARVGATNPGIIKSNTNPTPIAAKPQQEPKKEGGRGHGRSSGRGDGGGRDGGRGRGVVSSDARSLTKPMGK